MPTNPTTKIYDLDYFCLTDDNFLLCRREGQIIQLKPSEFQENDEILSQNQDKSIFWTKALKTIRKVPLGDKIVKVNTQRGVLFLTTGHKLFLENGEVIAAGNLQKDDRLMFSNQISLPNNLSIGVDKAYALGSFAAEGTSQKGVSVNKTGKWRAEWCLHYNEEVFATKILMSILSGWPGTNVQINSFQEYTRRIVACYDKNFVLELEKIGALGHCYEKRIPSIVFTSTTEEKAAFLAGLIEGDGTVRQNRAIVLKLTSKALIDGAHLLFETLGINTKLTTAKTDNRDVYLLSIYGKYNLQVFIRKCGRYLNGWKYLSRLQDYAQSDFAGIKHTIKDIEKAIHEFPNENSAKFSLLSGIPQASIKRIFGSWNKCRKHFHFETRRSKWGKQHTPNNQVEDRELLTNRLDIKSNKVISVDFLPLENEIEVFDFTISQTENFLIGTLVSHNSGSQTFLYIGDVWVDEVTGLQFQIQQNKQPIYGYASQLWDDVSAGRVMVQGGFSINFKEAGYLWAVLRRYSEITTSQALGESKVKSEKDAERKDKALLRRNSIPQKNNKPVVGSNARRTQRATIERIVQGKATKGELNQFYVDLAGFSTFDIENPKDKIFEDIVEEFEDQIWKEKVDNSTLNSQIRRTDDVIFDGFDIYVVWGNYSNPRANHTVQKITDVRLLGQGKTIVIDGQPIQENYSFIARSIV